MSHSSELWKLKRSEGTPEAIASQYEVWVAWGLAAGI